MKLPIIVMALVAAAVVAAPAEAKKRKQGQAPQPVAAANGSYDVTDWSGRVVGRDPDPNIRAAIRRDPRPWEGTN